MTDSDSRMIGELTGQMRNMNEQQSQFREETRDNFKQVFGKIESLSVGGCAVGKFQTQQIEELKRRPGKIVSIMAAFVAMIGAFLTWWNGK